MTCFKFSSMKFLILFFGKKSEVKLSKNIARYKYDYNDTLNACNELSPIQMSTFKKLIKFLCFSCNLISLKVRPVIGFLMNRMMTEFIKKIEVGKNILNMIRKD